MSEVPIAAKPVFWRDPKVRGYFFQALLVIFIFYFGKEIWSNMNQNMEARGIGTGFDFLSVKAGFPILYSPFIDFNPSSSTYFDSFLVGLFNTILVSFLGIITATILGVVFGVLRLSKNWLVAKIASLYIEIFRNIPLLVQIIFWYFAVFLTSLPAVRESINVGNLFLNNRGMMMPKPILESGSWFLIPSIVLTILAIYFVRKWARKRKYETGQNFPVFLTSIGLFIVVPLFIYFISGANITFDLPALGKFRFSGGMLIPMELLVLWFSLTIYTAAFIAEIVRSGIQSVPHGQTEAAQSLGLSPSQSLRLVIMPQALRVIIPPLTSQFLNLTKNSSLATAIGYPELVAVFAGTALNQVGRAVEIIVMTMLVYLAISLSISLFMNWYNKFVAIVER